MPRPRRLRRVKCMPDVNYFKPAGIGMKDLEETILTIDEYEAVRLKDFEGIEQTKAAKKMQISQPTFNRLLTSARKKISDAIVNGKAIKIEGGDFKMAKPLGRGQGGPGKGLRRGTIQGKGHGRMGGISAGPEGYCICPKCRTKVKKQRAKPCTERQCPECGAMMTRD